MMTTILFCAEWEQCIVLLQDWTRLVPNLILDAGELTIVDRFTHLVSCLPNDSSSAVEFNRLISPSDNRIRLNGSCLFSPVLQSNVLIYFRIWDSSVAVLGSPVVVVGRSSPPTGVACNLKQSLSVIVSSWHFHFSP